METSENRLAPHEKLNRLQRVAAPFLGAILLYLLLVAGLRSTASPVMAAPGNPPPQKDFVLARQTAPNQDFQFEKSSSSIFSIGATGQYTLQVGVLSTQTITSPLTVTDQFAAGFISPSVTAGAGWDPCSITSSELTCIYSATAVLTTGQSLPPIHISGLITETAAPLIPNTARLEYSLGENIEFLTDTITTTVESADLAVSKNVTPASVEEGSPVTFVITVTNNGPSPAANIVLTDSLSTDLTFTTADPSQGSFTPANGRWQVGPLADSAQATLRITATPKAGTSGKTITNQVSGLSSDLFDYDPDNNTASAQFRVAATGLTGRVTALGTTTAVPSGTVFLTDAQDRVYSTTTTTTGYYTFTETTAAPLAPGTAIVSAFSSVYYTQTKGIILEAGVLSTLNFELKTADLVVTKTDGATTASPGSDITYDVVISNTGTYTATGLIITDTLTSNMTFDNDTVDELDPTIEEDHRLVWKPTVTLAPGEQITYTIITNVASSLPLGTNNLDNTIKVYTASREANKANNTATDRNTYTSTSRPSISVTKTASRSSAARGQDIIYTITVRNSGSGSATDVEISDRLSTYLTLDKVTSTSGRVTTNTSNRSFTVDNIDTLDRNETVTVRVETRVSSTAPDNTSITNAATVRYKEGTTTRTATSSTVRVTLTGGSTLPGTGWGPPGSAGLAVAASHLPKTASSSLFWLALVICLLLGGLGAVAVFYARHNQETQPDWAAWARKNGIILFGAAAVFFLIAAGLGVQQVRAGRFAQRAAQPVVLAERPIPTPTRFRSLANPQQPVYNPLSTVEPETLPDFPIPTPTLPATINPDDEQPDTSPVNRIMIPQLGLDTIVKYVPYDESSMTWLIAGLQNEVAWMGDTSWPGLGGNTALAGHVTLRSGAEGPFRYLENMKAGAEIKLYTEQNVYRYRVQETKVVSDVDMSITQPTDKTRLTLITCTDWNEDYEMYMKRLVVLGELEEVYPLAQQSSRTGSDLALLNGIR